jgi:acetylornithine deacetylase/succinyl-diaminopimelate desuccinylase-like protein
MVAATLTAGTPAGGAAQETTSPPEYREMARGFLQELIEIDTNVDDGNITAAAEAMANRLRAAGFPDEDILVGGPTPTKGNLVVRYPGRDPNLKPLLALAHIDVVAADPGDWTIPPFEFLERDGYFWGRGVTDDKDEAAIYVANLIRMKQEGFVPERGIVVALTADEEGGDHNGVVWLLENHRDWIDAAYALNEGGGGMEREGRRVSNNVQASEKVYQSFTLEATNPGGHSSLPVKKNAIYDLSRALLAVQEHDFPVLLNEVTEAYFTRTAEIVGGDTGAAMRAILADPTNEAALAVLGPEPQYNGRLRTTCVATQLTGGHAENALPQLARATVNCRIVPTQDPAEVLSTLRELAGPEITVTPIQDPQPSPPSPLTDEVLGEIERITEEMWPGVPVLPIMSTGATDALYLRNAGVPVYGVSGLFHDVDDVRAHGQDERIRIDHFFEGQEFLYRLMKALTAGRVS